MSAKFVVHSIFDFIVVAGAFTVALSLLQLIVALVPLALVEPVSHVMRAYSGLIANAVQCLFGQLDLAWMKVTELEGHVMVLTAAVLAIIAREALVRLRSRKLRLATALCASVSSCRSRRCALLPLHTYRFCCQGSGMKR